VQDSTPTAKGSADNVDIPEKVEAWVYGLRKHAYVRAIVNRMLDVPCLPWMIFRIDKMGKKVGVVDRLTRQTYYVNVLSWGKGKVVVSWTTNPRLDGKYTKSRADKALTNLMLPGNPLPTQIFYDAREALRRAKLLASAS
jgi:hypothetical protein